MRVTEDLVGGGQEILLKDSALEKIEKNKIENIQFFS